MHWVRHLSVALLLAGVVVSLASAQRQQGRPPRAETRGPVRAAPQNQRTPGQLGVEVSNDGGGVRVEGFALRSPAQRAGMRAGDRIVAVEGRSVEDVDRVLELVRSRSAGTEVKLRLRRTVVVRLDEGQRTEDGRLALGLVLGGEDGGLQVSAAPPGYAGAAAGVAAGDRVVELDGVALSNLGQLVEHMRSVEAARGVRVTFERDLRVRLGAAEGRDAASEPGASTARRAAPVSPPARAHTAQDIAAEVASLRRELQALRAELAELRKVLSGD